jgi:hypothetical protein
MRIDGKFMVGDDIPDGQAAINQLLAECFDIAYELRAEADENERGKDEDDEQPVEIKTSNPTVGVAS